MNTNDVAELAVIGTIGGQQHIHTLHLRSTDGTVGLQGLIDDWQANAQANYRAMFVSGSDEPIQLLRARQVAGALPFDATAEEAQGAGSKTGTRALGALGQPMPQFCASVVSVRTGRAGRSYRGRNYFGGLFEGDQDNGVLNATYIALVDAYIGSLNGRYLTNIALSKWEWVVFSRKQFALGAGVANYATRVASWIVRTEIGTMRSRKIGHGQ